MWRGKEKLDEPTGTADTSLLGINDEPSKNEFRSISNASLSGESRSWRSLDYCSLPEWLKDNEFLYDGHRPPLPSFADCFCSIFRRHTETMNIWTHLLGAAFFLIILLHMLAKPSQLQEKLVFATYFLSAVICMSLSFVCHTVACHSPEVGILFAKFDYVGIVLLIIGSFVPWLFYMFYCYRRLMVTYLLAACLLGAMCILVTLDDTFSKARYRIWRAILFVSLGLFGLVPAFHYLIYLDGFDPSFRWLTLMAVIYITGALFYATRVPERLAPGRCDIWFHSHQLFHIFVLVGALVHYYGVSQLADRRLAGSCKRFYVI